MIRASDVLTKFCEERKPTPRKVVKLVQARPENDAERCCLDHLKRYLKSREGNISNFLLFVTGSDILTCTSIKVTFNTLEGLIRMPVAHSSLTPDPSKSTSTLPTSDDGAYP